MHQFLLMSNPLLSLGAVGAGTTDVQTGAEVSMSPQFDAVLFIAMLGTITATGLATLRARGSNTTGVYGAGTVGVFQHVDSGVAVQAEAFTGDDNLLLAIDIYRPLTQFVRPEIVRATANIVITGMIAIPYQSKAQQATFTGFATHATVAGWDAGSNPQMSTT